MNTNAPFDFGADFSPSVAMDGANRVIVVWTSTDTLMNTIGTDSDILVARSMDRGVTWSAPAALAPNAFIDTGADRNPQIITDGVGNYVVVWESSDSLFGTIGNDLDILMSRSTDGGLTWSFPAPLNINAASDTGADRTPRIATDRAGNWMAVWASTDSLGSTTGTDSDIMMASSSDFGGTWSPPVAVNSNAFTDTAADTRPVVAANEVDAWVIAWTSNDSMGGTIGNDTDILFSRSSDQGSSWSPMAPLNGNAAWDTGADDGVDLAADGAGVWVAAWHSFEPLPWGPDADILVARTSNNATTWTIPVALYSFELIELGDEFDPRVITDRLGNWVVVWWREDSLPGSLSTDVDVLLARSTNNGVGWVGPEPINFDALTDTGDDYQAAVATDRAGNFLAVWASDDPLGGTVGNDMDIFIALSVCGDGVQSITEQCDDANIFDGDCCSSTCNLAPAGAVCRMTAGACDVTETCDGIVATCPADGLVAPGTVCRNAAGSCDLPEVCEGTVAGCPADDVVPNGQICRGITGPCDVAEACDGIAFTCPVDDFMTAGSTCRAANGACDVADTCSGTASSCADAFVPAGTSCRVAVDVCDQPEACSGNAPACPADSFSNPGITCRASAGACDQPEACTGSQTSCPPDALVPAGTLCRGAAQGCDAAESCDGLAVSCPVDLFMPDGAPCVDGTVCDGSERCAGGACVSGAPLGCGDSDSCTADFCSEPGGCGSSPIAGCCNSDADCADSNACTTNVCSGPGGTCNAITMADCCNNDAECNDGDECTIEVCSAPGGTCGSSAITGCCTEDADCNDSSSCTTDSCDLTTYTCTFAAVDNCCASDADCEDSNACTTDSCDLSDGTCVRATIADCCVTNADCSDGDSCTTDVCNGGTCTSTVIGDCCVTDSDCGGGDLCAIASCSLVTNRCEEAPIDGCCQTDADCAPTTGCNAMACDTTSNICAPVLVTGCCSIDDECDDEDPCTFDQCALTACTHSDIVDCTVVVDPDGGVADGGDAGPDTGLDTGLDGGLDTGTMIDAGTEIDAGSEGTDGSTQLSDGAVVDSDGGGTLPDADTLVPDAGGFPFDDDSCECNAHTTHGNSSAAVLLGFVGLGFVLRRRRSSR